MLLNWTLLCQKDPNQAESALAQMTKDHLAFFQSIRLILQSEFAKAQELLHPLILRHPQSEWVHCYWKLSWMAPADLEFLNSDAFYALIPSANADEWIKQPQFEFSSQPKEAAMAPSNSNVAHLDQNFYGQVLLTPQTLANIASSAETWAEILMFHKYLATDPYVSYLDQFYRLALKRYGAHWNYFDISNVVYAAAKTTQPTRYLEIGVRRGRTLCCAVEACPNVDLYAFDMWVQNYAGMDNPGPDFVRSELKRHGHTGKAEFINGNSHQTLPAFFAANPGMQFDMITVDGDHTAQGAMQDLEDVLPHLAPGGILIFDDISHPQHMYLLEVWKMLMSKHPELSDFCYTEAGYGVAFAIKMR